MHSHRHYIWPPFHHLRRSLTSCWCRDPPYVPIPVQTTLTLSLTTNQTPLPASLAIGLRKPRPCPAVRAVAANRSRLLLQRCSHGREYGCRVVATAGLGATDAAQPGRRVASGGGGGYGSGGERRQRGKGCELGGGRGRGGGRGSRLPLHLVGAARIGVEAAGWRVLESQRTDWWALSCRAHCGGLLALGLKGRWVCSVSRPRIRSTSRPSAESELRLIF